ncbi:MAG: FmdB family transcriptional regulator [Mycobacterium sp.]|nr:FmdB family transcriptional regulator [Mycobacterium sp.]
MPTYSYACTECDHRFDAVQAFTDDALTTCPQCSGRLRKLFNSVGVVFKGSGFYRTDSRGENGGKVAKGESSSADKSSEKSTTAEKSSSSSDSSGSSSGSTSTTSSAPATASS